MSMFLMFIDFDTMCAKVLSPKVVIIIKIRIVFVPEMLSD